MKQHKDKAAESAFFERINKLPEPIARARLKLFKAERSLHRAMRITYPIGTIIKTSAQGLRGKFIVSEYANAAFFLIKKIRANKQAWIRPDHHHPITIISKPETK